MSATDADTTESTLTNPLTDLTAFQIDLLRAIDDLEKNDRIIPSGQDVKDRVENYGRGNINHGRLYPNLDTLMNKGLIEKGEIDRRTNSYQISTRGSDGLESYAAFVSGE